MGTMLVIKVSPESASQFGELEDDPITNELLHYTEKPETFVSDMIKCGVYVFNPNIFHAIQNVSNNREDKDLDATDRKKVYPCWQSVQVLSTSVHSNNIKLLWTTIEGKYRCKMIATNLTCLGVFFLPFNTHTLSLVLVSRQALANALAKAPSTWALGNAGMGALQRLAEDSSPAIAATASRAIYALNKQWEIEEGDARGKTKQ